MPSDSRKLADWLQRPDGPLHAVLSHTEQLVQINRAFRDWLREPWSDAVRIAAVNGETTVLHAAHAGAATLLRFRAEAIVAFIRERYNPACTDIQISVRPDTYTVK